MNNNNEDNNNKDNGNKVNHNKDNDNKVNYNEDNKNRDNNNEYNTSKCMGLKDFKYVIHLPGRHFSSYISRTYLEFAFLLPMQDQCMTCHVE